MRKRLVEIDDAALEAARAHFGTATIKDTVNRALSEVADGHARDVDERMAALASAEFAPREDAWR